MEGFFKPSEIRSSRSGGELAAKCGACGLFRGCRSPKMKPWGRGSLGVLVVGEAPEESGDEQGRPISGDSAEFLREAVGRVGFEFDQLKITNAIICRPPDDKMPKKGKELDWCRPNLSRTISDFKPKVIITLGKSATESVLKPYWKGDFGTMERWTGHRIPLENHWICPTWLPSHVREEDNRMMSRMFSDHLEAALRIKELPPSLPDFKSKIELIYEERKAVEAIRWFDEQGGVIAFDYETNCLKPEYPKARIFSCSISNGRRTVAYPWWGRAVDATSLLLRSGRTRKIASNMKFEQRWTVKHLGHPVTNWDWDTVIAAHVLDNRTSIASLKFQSFVLMGVPTYNEHIESYLKSKENSHYNRIHELDLAELLLYNGMDALLEFHLAKRQKVRFCRHPEPEGCYERSLVLNSRKQLKSFWQAANEGCSDFRRGIKP
jgi:uracil-DNA glycosylase family 4